MLTLFAKDQSKQILYPTDAFYKALDKKSKKERFCTEQELREKCQAMGHDILKENYLAYNLN